MRVEQLAINSQCTSHRNLEEALDAYAAAGFRNVEPHLNLIKDWLADGHTVEEARRLFESRGLRVVASSQLEVICFGSPDARMPNLRANAENARLIRELGADKMIVGTDGPEQNSVEALGLVADAVRELAEVTDDTGVEIAIEFNWSPIVRSLQSAVRVAELADHPRVGVLFDTAHYHVTPTKLADINRGSVRYIKHVHLDDMPDKPADLTHRDFDRVLPGEGVIDLPEIISALERNGYDGFFSVELFNAELWRLPAKEAARRCYESLVRLCS
ncbi:Xylose isomerase-like TIM barrel [Rubrobacter xylanophilus DSM 9941]|uniref:Xylose isomerase-like TIM barrel n=1 Tax=Rubrobacter xylanophilus (strain DSM 9941 / JCM 11954 / NBRC 16129 / PRD-1) TaxID=266117 RepID=Q1AVA3_RUBXD|nr:sugar phosphate isomerase/epimerase family protein [Rubrobacter xylanophilus]ABG04675.1 Xylose isomerase-like TIM barrel [Rubrobacter xylanophilus DSM 9941]